MDIMNQNKKILVVEDDAPMLRALIDKLRLEGFAVREAKEGHAGLKIALEEKPDLILLDILMPIMDGLTMLKELRGANTYGKTVPVILLTNLSADKEEIMRTVAETEPSYYLVKPNFTLSQIMAKVKEQLLGR